MISSPSPVARSRGTAFTLGVLAVTGALLAGPGVTAAVGDTPAPSQTQAAAAAAGSTITAAAAQLTEGQPLEVSWQTDTPHRLNWIGIYPPSAGTPDGNPGSTQWQYTPGTSGTVTFANLPAGTWLVYFLAEDGYAQLASPLEITIAADPEKPQPGDPAAPVEIDPVVTDVSTDGVIVREGFAVGAAPAGWAVDVAGGAAGDDAADYRGWTFTTRGDWTSTVDEMRGRFARPLGALAVADAQQFGGALDTTLTGAPVDVAGLGAVRLTFDSHYRGAADQSGVVRVSFDGGASTEILRLDADSVADGYDARQMNYAQDVVVDVPGGAEQAVFSWQFTAETGARYWAIDSVAVHAVQQQTDAEPTQAWIMSDIQGHPADWQHAIGDYDTIAPDADGMLLVGDIVNSGTTAEWDEIYAVMDATADIRPRQTIGAIGNHERYAPGGFDANRDRFLAFADRDKVWDEYVLEGAAGELPVIVLGQEFASPSDVAMSDAQVEFLEERLAHWTAQDKQVVVMTHFPLGDTVSASWIPGYHRHHQMNDRLTSILGNYPNAIIFTGHTHYPAELGDWAVQRRTGDGHPDGFWAINTLAMHVEWDARGENTAGISEVTTRDIDQGLTLDAYGDRVVVTAHDFETDEQLRQVVIPNPLVPFQAVAGEPADTVAPTVTTKADTIGADGVYEKVSFKLYDEGKIDRAVLNGIEKDLVDNTWSDLNFVAPGVFGAVLGENTLEVFDVAGNVTTVEFTLVEPKPRAPAWQPGRVYVAGDTVTHAEAVHVAQWWTIETPGSSATGSWMEQGAAMVCAAGEIAGWTPSQVYTGGEQVVAAGEVYEAKWWSRNQRPGDRHGPWSPVGAC